jgi:hypothetical protein
MRNLQPSSSLATIEVESDANTKLNELMDEYNTMCQYLNKLKEIIDNCNRSASQKSLSQTSNGSNPPECRLSQEETADIFQLDTVIKFITKFYVERTPVNQIVDEFLRMHKQAILGGSSSQVVDFFNNEPERLQPVLEDALENCRVALAKIQAEPAKKVPPMRLPMSGLVEMVQLPPSLHQHLSCPSGPALDTDLTTVRALPQTP